MKYHRDIDHTPLKKKPDMQDTLANQIREKIFNNIQSVPAVDIIFKALHGARIFLKDITTHGYTPADIR